MKKNILLILAYLFSFSFSIFIILFDKKTSDGFMVFFLWFLNFTMILIITLAQVPKTIYHKIFLVILEDWKILILIFALAVFTRFFLLGNYPYVSFGDQIRDTGINAVKIARGESRDFFTFGDYQGYGNFIPLISYFFLLILGHASTLIYLIPSSIIGVLSIILTYFLARLWQGRKVAFCASLILIVSFFHLHYSRSELLVIMDSFLALLILLGLFLSWRLMIGSFIFGLIAGFSLHFYAGTRGMVAISFLFAVFAGIYKIITSHKKALVMNIKHFFLWITLFFIGFLISLGPRITRFNLDNSYARIGQTQIIFQNKEFLNEDLSEKSAYLYKTYVRSFLVYTFENNTDFHFNYRSALLGFPINWFFLGGLFYLLLSSRHKENFLSNLLVFVIFIYPITSQVIVDSVGADHRLMGILPVLAVVAGYGLVKLTERFSLKIGYFVLIVFFIIFIPWQLNYYFNGRLSDINFEEKPLNNYILSEMIDEIKNDKTGSRYYILNSADYDYNFIHYKEDLTFLTFPKQVDLILTYEELKDLLANQDKKFILSIEKPPANISLKVINKVEFDCSKTDFFSKYRCPLNFKGKYSFYKIY